MLIILKVSLIVHLLFVASTNFVEFYEIDQHPSVPDSESIYISDGFLSDTEVV